VKTRFWSRLDELIAIIEKCDNDWYMSGIIIRRDKLLCHSSESWNPVREKKGVDSGLRQNDKGTGLRIASLRSQ
jgi:hypothetical protein